MQRMAEQVDAMFNQCFANGANDREFLYAVHSFHTQFHPQNRRVYRLPGASAGHPKEITC